MTTRSTESRRRSAAGGTDWCEFRTRPDAGIDLLSARFTRHVYERHAHDSYAIGITLGGAQAFHCHGARHVSTAGRIIVFNPDVMHDGQAGDARGFSYRMLYVDPGRLADATAEASGRRAGLPWFPEVLIDDPPLFARLRAAGRALAAPESRLAAEVAVQEALAALALRHADARPAAARVTPDRAVRSVRDVLYARFAEDVALDDLARCAGRSRWWVIRAFQAAYGLPPGLYQRRLRLEAARRLLAAGEPAAEVAAEVGFVDQSHLIRRFKGAYGVTPAAFRRACTSVQSGGDSAS